MLGADILYQWVMEAIEEEDVVSLLKRELQLRHFHGECLGDGPKLNHVGRTTPWARAKAHRAGRTEGESGSSHDGEGSEPLVVPDSPPIPDHVSISDTEDGDGGDDGDDASIGLAPVVWVKREGKQDELPSPGALFRACVAQRLQRSEAGASVDKVDRGDSNEDAEECSSDGEVFECFAVGSLVEWDYSAILSRKNIPDLKSWHSQVFGKERVQSCFGIVLTDASPALAGNESFILWIDSEHNVHRMVCDTRLLTQCSAPPGGFLPDAKWRCRPVDWPSPVVSGTCKRWEGIVQECLRDGVAFVATALTVLQRLNRAVDGHDATLRH